MQVGIWIDRRKAYLFSLDGEDQRVERIDSDVEGKSRPAGKTASASTGNPRQMASDRKTDERRRHQLHRYYRRIGDEVQTADSVYIFGPGRAKEELEKELTDGLVPAEHIAAVEAADKMTRNQMAARVRDFFGVN